MKRALRISFLILAVVVLLAAAIFAAVPALEARKAQRRVDVPATSLEVVDDPAARQRGDYLYRSRGCAECHGIDGGGRIVIDDPNGLFVRSPNLSSATHGVVRTYGTADWERAIRHGVDPAGRPLLVMPSEDYNRLTDADLAALVAHIRALPPVEGVSAEIRFPWIVKALYVAGIVRDAAEKIDHLLPPSRPVPITDSIEHGAYVAQMCTGCHGAGFSGGPIPGAPPAWPAAANLTPGSDSALLRYDAAEAFIAMMRTGRRGDGSPVSTVMPFSSLAALDDTDLRALYRFLRSLPPRAGGHR